MHRFYLSPDCFLGDEVVWDEKESWHICRVMRLNPSDRVIGFDGKGSEYEIELQSVTPKRVTGTLLNSKVSSPLLPVQLELIQSLAKADKMDWIIQKNVEVGIAEIRPMITRYTVVKWEAEQQEKRLKRWESIVKEACKQCRRNDFPILYPVGKWETFLLQMDPNRLYLLLYETKQKGDLCLKAVLQQNREKIHTFGIGILVGPEGGWSEQEVKTAREHGIYIVNLGPRIFRTETAGLVVAAAILYEMDGLQ